MFGHVAGRQHPSRWVLVSFLFAAALAWSFSVMGDRIGNSWGFLRLGLTLAIAVSVVRLGTMTMMWGKKKKARKHADEADAEDEGEHSADETDEHRLTYEEIFGTPANGGVTVEETESIDGAPIEPPEEPEQVEDVEYAEQAEWAEPMAADVDELGQAEVDELEPAQAQADEDEVDDEAALEAELDAAVQPVEQIQADLEAEEQLRRMREQLKARAKEAELHIKQREAELDDASSAQQSP